MFSLLPDLKRISDCGRLKILCLNGGEEWGSGWACRHLWGSVGTCRYLWESVGICRDLQGSVWLHTLRHSAIWLWGPASSPVLQPLAPGKIISRTRRTTIRSPSWSYPQDGRTAPLRVLNRSHLDRDVRKEGGVKKTAPIQGLEQAPEYLVYNSSSSRNACWVFLSV